MAFAGIAEARDGALDYVPSLQHLAALPPAVDLRATTPGFPPVYTQGALNSCTAQVLAALLYHHMGKHSPADAFEPSRLFIYYNERARQREIGKPRHGRRGAPVRMDDCIRSAAANGFCREAQWPYVAALSDVKPASALYDFAARQRSHRYLRVAPDIGQLKACLAEGYPFACGIAMYQSFLGSQVRQSGVVSLPGADEVLRGGHAEAVVGYDDARGRFIARNSFGPEWGDAGHCYLPYEFLSDPRYGFDFWIVRSAREGGGESSGGAIKSPLGD